MSAGSLLRRPSVFLALGLCAIAAVTTVLGRLSNGPQTESKRTVLPDVTGVASYPAFSPDGNRLAYSQRGLAGADTFHIIVRRLPTGAPQQLTNAAANDTSPAWSPDGNAIAFVRTQDEQSQVVVIPSSGGSEKTLAEFPAPRSEQGLPSLNWARDGKTLVATVGGDEKQSPALALIDASTGALKRITSPEANSEGDWNPMFFPDGSRIVFVRAAGGPPNIYTCARDGSDIRQVTFESHVIHGMAWMPNGRELLYSADRTRDYMIWRTLLDSPSPHATLLSPHGQFPAVAGSRVAFTESPAVTSEWRATLNPGSPAPASDKPLLRSQGSDAHASYSPDGKQLAFLSDTSGTDQIWLSDSEGGNRVQITKLAQDVDVRRPHWSPDGKWLLYQVSGDSGWEIYKVAAAPGAEPKRIALGGEGVAWAHDGKSIFYQSRGQLYQANVDGGEPKPLTQERRGRVDLPVASPDGKYVYFRAGSSVRRVSVKGGDTEQVFDMFGTFVIDIEPGRNGLYFEAFNTNDGSLEIGMYNYESKQTAHVLRLEGPRALRRFAFSFRGADFAVSPDGKYILHPRVDQSQTNLILVENFK